MHAGGYFAPIARPTETVRRGQVERLREAGDDVEPLVVDVSDPTEDCDMPPMCRATQPLHFPFKLVTW